MAWLDRFLGGGVTPDEVRAEVWKLGVRHNGWPLEGAREELKSGTLSVARANLLRACVRKLSAA